MSDPDANRHFVHCTITGSAIQSVLSTKHTVEADAEAYRSIRHFSRGIEEMVLFPGEDADRWNDFEGARIRSPPLLSCILQIRRWLPRSS